LGRIRLDAVTRTELLSLFHEAIVHRSQITVLLHNLHGIYVQYTTPVLEAIYAGADWVYVDGMPVVWLAKAAGLPFEAAHRTTLLDCFEQVLSEAASNGWRVFYFGGKQEVLTHGLTKLRAMYPTLEIDGHHGYVTADQTQTLIEEIRAFRADILFVGLGTPIQEIWVAEHKSSIDVPVITTCGATMEYTAGYVYRPPAWAGKLGLQGVARLMSNPKRLWKRYLVEPLLLAPYLGRAILKRRFGSSEDPS
jgi:N-acetylglucosaminyldiphosphoundecaprenol N-acetyl-beta-D-mannosaminyltransferase